MDPDKASMQHAAVSLRQRVNARTAPPQLRRTAQAARAVPAVQGGPAEHDLQSPSLTMLVLLATLGTLLYASFLLNPANAGDPLPFILVVVCETFLIFQALLALWTALSSTYNPRNFAFWEAKRQLFDGADGARSSAGSRRSESMRLDGSPISVDVFVPTYGEPVAVVEATLVAAVAMRGRHETYLLDDAKSPEMAALCKRLGVRYITRRSNKGAKAGNINHALGLSHGNFFVIFDADFVPRPEFLAETVPFFSDELVAFVQTPQVYGNIHNFISRGAGFMQTVFYSLTQPGKNRFNAAFCVGTNVIFRRSVIDSLGGIYEGSKSEDIWTSLFIHELGLKSIYIPKVLAVGATPETIESYSKQQLRWATGAFEILLTRNPFSPKRRLTTDQRLQYFGTATFYFSGVIPLVLILLPPLQIFLSLTPVSSDVPLATWLLYYCGFYVMQIVMAFYTIGSFRWQTLVLSAVSFPIYVRAFFNALTRRDGAWHVTGSKGSVNSPFAFITVQMIVFIFLVATTIVGIWKFDWTGQFSIALVWNVINMFALGYFVIVAIRESGANRLDRKALKRSSSPAKRSYVSDPMLVAPAQRVPAPSEWVAAPSGPATSVSEMDALLVPLTGPIVRPRPKTVLKKPQNHPKGDSTLGNNGASA
jgi:cellulose synthase (UDP-forming)